MIWTELMGTRAKRLVVGVAVSVLLQAGAVSAALEGRDINENPVDAFAANAVFAYDTVLDATWYLTANSDALVWSDANHWAQTLTVGTHSEMLLNQSPIGAH